ncbi:putative PDDEXK endonuclease [Arcanobacterium haemolyticum]
MSRTRTSAKQAGARFERQIADTLAHYIDDRIDRRVKTGNKDRGDITGLRHMGQRIVVECKNVTRLQLSNWITQAEIERGNDDATVGLVIHKRHGKANPLDQYATMTLRDLIALLTTERPDA